MFSLSNSSIYDLFDSVFDLAAPPESSVFSLFYPLYFTYAASFHLKVLHYLQINESPLYIAGSFRVCQINGDIFKKVGIYWKDITKEIGVLYEPPILRRIYLVLNEPSILQD